MTLTKRDRKEIAAQDKQAATVKAIKNGFRPHMPGDVIRMSDCQYRVAADGSFIRELRDQ